jgi:integrase
VIAERQNTVSSLNRTPPPRLIPATPDLVIDGEVHDGMPLLLAGEVLEPAPSIYLVQAAGNSARTAWTYGRGLVAWWKLLSDRDLFWTEVTLSDLKAFSKSKRTATGSLYAIAVAGFYQWAYEQGLMDYRPFCISGSRSSRSLSGASRTPALHLPRRFRRQPKLVTRGELHAVLASSGRVDPGLLLRDELTAECGHYIGLRRRQVRGLTVAQVTTLGPDDIAYAIDLDPEYSKGGKEYPVLVPRQLVHKLRKYIETARASLVERCQEKDSRFREPKALFLTNQGKPMSEAYISTTWCLAARRAGIFKRFHGNRHAAGTGVAAGAHRFGIRPLRWVMSQLGHSVEKSSAGYTHLAEMERELVARAHVVNDRWEKDHIREAAA